MYGVLVAQSTTKPNCREREDVVRSSFEREQGCGGEIGESGREFVGPSVELSVGPFDDQFAYRLNLTYISCPREKTMGTEGKLSAFLYGCSDQGFTKNAPGF